jgi:hypothetical protein
LGAAVEEDLLGCLAFDLACCFFVLCVLVCALDELCVEVPVVPEFCCLLDVVVDFCDGV